MIKKETNSHNSIRQVFKQYYRKSGDTGFSAWLLKHDEEERQQRDNNNTVVGDSKTNEDGYNNLLNQRGLNMNTI